MSDESIRRMLMGDLSGKHISAPSPERGPRQMNTIDRAQAMELLGSVSLGRIVFTENALPVIRPVNHVLDAERIVIHTHHRTALAGQVSRAGAAGLVVAYQADTLVSSSHLGWSVVVTGCAHLVTGARAIARYQSLLKPWVEGGMDRVVIIRAEEVSGFRLVAEPLGKATAVSTTAG